MSLTRLLQSISRDLLPLARLEFRTASGLHLFVPDRGAWGSAAEVFMGRIYDPYLPHLTGVRRWVDLGCNNGFFSFGLLDYLTHATGSRPATQVFLGDANAECVRRVKAALEHNGLTPAWQCETTVIGPRDATVNLKMHKDSMHTNIFNRGHGRRSGGTRTTDISARLAGETAFDLIKIDVEGAEKFLFDEHLEFLRRFPLGLCEWHAPVFPGAEMKARLEQLGWPVLELRSQGATTDAGWQAQAGMVLWRNPAPLG